MTSSLEPPTGEAAGSNCAWRCVGASVAGPAHERAGLPCQDSHASRIIEGAVLVAVADGASSAPRSGRGAALACQTAIAALEKAWLERSPCSDIVDLLWGAVDTARQRVFAEAEAHGRRPRDFACTLLLLLATGEGAWCAHIGDGGAVAYLKDGGFTALSLPGKGEYANQTMFLTAEQSFEHLRISRTPSDRSVNGIAVFTDGCERQALDLAAGQPHAPFFLPLFAHIAGVDDVPRLNRELEQFLSSDRFCLESHDDKTLALVLRVAATEER